MSSAVRSVWLTIVVAAVTSCPARVVASSAVWVASFSTPATVLVAVVTTGAAIELTWASACPANASLSFSVWLATPPAPPAASVSSVLASLWVCDTIVGGLSIIGTGSELCDAVAAIAAPPAPSTTAPMPAAAATSRRP